MELFISKSQLTRLVRQHYGMTFHKLISSYRVNAAAKLLCDTDLPADKISAIVGIPDEILLLQSVYGEGLTPPRTRSERRIRRETPQ